MAPDQNSAARQGKVVLADPPAVRAAVEHEETGESRGEVLARAVLPVDDTAKPADRNRQLGIRSLARRCELVLVAGSASSGTTCRMVEVARQEGARSHLVPDAAHLRATWFDGVRTVGLSSGAGAPESLVQQVLERLAELGFRDVAVDVTPVGPDQPAPEGQGMRLLPSIREPADVRRLTEPELTELAAEIRRSLVDLVSRTGGHLGPSLGVVELTLALHRVFESPDDRILWDTGHQAYAHKMLTGRWRDFATLRQRGGLSGYPSRAESSHDVIENSHASTGLSYAYGLSTANQLLGDTGRRVVVVAGDGSLTGGMAWEALNSIAGERRRVVVVLNDNGRSYAPTVGGLARHLRGSDPGGFFTALGLGYVGPVDGHDVGAVQEALRRARDEDGPVVVHCLTSKGRGYRPAEDDDVDRFHAVRPMNPATGVPVTAGGGSWTSVFGAELVRLGEKRRDVVAITAAMRDPTGLTAFAERFPDRVIDVGIAEQHAVTAAAGLAMAGMRPVVAIYSTFLNRAFDQMLMDVSLHSCPVVFVLDRAGVTGDDGASHNGMWDLSLLNIAPRMRVAAPRDAATLRSALRTALNTVDGPAAIRFPKGRAGADLPAAFSYGGLDVLRPDPRDDLLLVSVGAMAGVCLEVAELLHARGIGVTVMDPQWIRPVNPLLLTVAPRFRLVATVEDNLRVGGFGSLLAQEMRAARIGTPLVDFGIPHRFLAHGTRSEVLAGCGLTAAAIAADLAARLSAPVPSRVPGGIEPRGAVR
ncbi:1-deoxy-D-xylulose-5-phosphate synthase [Amycolatopsis sp. NPDC049252]|uniref:1-deoxy-D-xylulose-5-phosphate synthase n=1 Tax=Amycolatopsis sp. NPDC049252 TaxID=3363933 RepID=UPI00371987F5